ncbi:MAG: PilZ domain-containing protein [Candidatus Zixiibacteriota bacterium]
MAVEKTSRSGERTRRMIEELPLLLNQDISVQKNPADGVVYSAKVLGVERDRLQITLPRGLPDFGYLRDTCPVMITFVIDGTLYEAMGKYLAENKQQRELVVDKRIVESNRRSSRRVPLAIETVYVPISDLSLTSGQLSNLKWRRCKTLDFSSGGLLLALPVQAPVKSYFLLNLEIDTFEGPLFAFGQIRWITKSDGPRTEFNCGVQFIPSELLLHHFSKRALTGLSPMLLGFTRKKQIELDRYLASISSNHKGGA